MSVETTHRPTSDMGKKSRATILQEADPYFPHTFWRAVLWATAMGLMTLGFASVMQVIFGLGSFGWFQIGMIAAQMVVTAGVCYFGRGLRVQLLEAQGKIPKEENL